MNLLHTVMIKEYTIKNSKRKTSYSSYVNIVNLLIVCDRL